MNTSLSDAERCRHILAAMGEIPVLVPGKLATRRDRGGKITGYKLQHWHQGRNETRHVPRHLMAQVEAGTAGYRRFMALCEEFVALRAQQAFAAVGPAEDSKKKSMRP